MRSAFWNCSRGARCWVLHDGCGYFPGDVWTYERFSEVQGERQGSARALGGDERAVRHDRFRLWVWQFAAGAEVGGVAGAVEKSGILEEQRRCADGGYGLECSGVLAGEDGGGSILSKPFHLGAAGEKQEIKRERVFDLRECGVCVHDDAVAARDVDGDSHGSQSHLYTGAAKDVDGGDGFDFLKSVRDETKDAFHGLNAVRWKVNAKGEE